LEARQERYKESDGIIRITVTEHRTLLLREFPFNLLFTSYYIYYLGRYINFLVLGFENRVLRRIFWVNIVSTIEELLGGKSSGSGLENFGLFTVFKSGVYIMSLQYLVFFHEEKCVKKKEMLLKKALKL
jgi:hypothetical protein